MATRSQVAWMPGSLTRPSWTSRYLASQTCMATGSVNNVSAITPPKNAGPTGRAGLRGRAILRYTVTSSVCPNPFS